MPRLVIHTPGHPPLLYELVRKRVTIGRSDRNDLPLEDANVSRFHAAVEQTPEGYHIVDLQSRNGLFVGEQRVPAAALKDGITVRVGDTSLRFEDSRRAWEHTVIAQKASPIEKVEMETVDQQGLADASIALKEVAEEPVLPKSVTELQQQLSEVRRRALLFEIVSRIRRLLHNITLPQEMLDKIPALVFSATRAERVLVTTWDEEKQSLRPAPIHTAPGIKLKDTQIALSTTLLNAVLVSRRGVIVRDARADPQLIGSKSAVLSGLRSAICAPMCAHNRVYGLIYVDNTRLPMVFDEGDLEVLSLLAFEAALILDSAGVREELTKQEGIRDVYRRFLPGQLTDQMLANPESALLGGEKRAITALFADLRGFTSLAETLPPEQAVELLNSFFTEMCRVIFRYNGMVNKYLGDGMLTVFGAPLATDDNAIRAVECAMEMQSALTAASKEWQNQGLPVIHMGIGVNSGEAIAGNVGSPERMEYTVIGDTVNVAARLTANAKPGEILLGDTTFQEIQGQIPTETLTPQPLKGKREPVKVYRVLQSIISGEEPSNPV